MRLTERANDFFDLRDWYDGFDADFLGALQPTALSDGRIRPFFAEECAGSGDAKAARRILADASGACGEECVAYGLQILLRHERHELVLRRLWLNHPQR